MIETSKEIIPSAIVCDDVLAGLSRITDASVHLIVTSPPYNANIDYDNWKDNLPHAEYLSWMRKVFTECFRVLQAGGRMCLNIDATTNTTEDVDGLVLPLHVDFTNILREIGFLYRGEVIWCKQNAPGSPTAWGSYGLCSNPRFKRNTEYIIMAFKGNSKLEGDSTFCDLKPEEFQKWSLTEWRFAPETRKSGHPVPFPRELPNRCIKLFSYVGNTVLDPFNGSGTTTTTAFELGRKYLGIDNSELYCTQARNEIKNAGNYMKLNLKKSDPDARLFGGYSWIPAPVLLKRSKISKQARGKSLPSIIPYD